MCVCSHSRSKSSSRLWRWTTELAHRWPYLVFVGLWLIASDGWAQGPLRRLGGRVREAIQSGGPLVPPQAPAVPAARGPANQSAAASANAQAAQSRFPSLRTGQVNGGSAARTTGARPTGASANYQRAASTGQSLANNSATSNRLPQPAYAVPADNRARSIGQDSMATASTANGEARSLEVAKLGLKVSDDTVAVVNHQTGRASRGVLVLAVLVGSGGDAAGLQSGDRLLAVNGRLVNQAEPLVDMVNQITPGDPIELKFNRAGTLYSTVGLASGPTGKLDREEFAIVREQAREMLGEVAAAQGQLPIANDGVTSNSSSEQTTPGSNSALGGLGNALGSWFGSTTSKAKPQTSSADPNVPAISEPNARDVDSPATTKDTATTADTPYKSLRPMNATLAASGVADSDPPSLESEPNLEASETGADETLETLPAPQPADNDATIEQLLKEIRLLRERVQQLEAQKAPEVR